MSEEMFRPRLRLLAVPLGIAAALIVSACSSSSSGGGGGDESSSASSSSSSGAFKVDTAECDDPASATKKITGTIKIGYSAPLSGPVAGVAALALDGYKARVDYENSKGGINGVKIDLQLKDDAYTPDKAKANGTDFLQNSKVDILNTFGSGQVGAMVDDSAAACVPFIYPSSSEQKYRVVKDYPWLLQLLPAGEAEARYDVNVIKSKFPGAKVGIAENQTASGKAESAAFQDQAKGAGLTVTVVTPMTDYAAAATALKAANVDVVYDAGITNDCGPLLIAMGRVGFTPKMVVHPSNCADKNSYISAGAAAEGSTIPVYIKDVTTAASAAEPAIKDYLAATKSAKDNTNTITQSGWLSADLTIEAIKQASSSKSGLTHVSIIQAARNMSYAAPILVNGAKWISTPTVQQGVDKFQTQVWSVAAQKFQPSGDLIDISAK